MEDFQQINEDGLDELVLDGGGYVDCQSEEIHSEDRKELGFQRKNDMFLLISQKLSATTVTKKGTLLGNADLKGIKRDEDLSNVFEVEPINYALLAILLQAHKSSDEENTPANDRFSKADRFHVVPPPITWNFLTPRADISFVDDEDDVSEVQTVSPVKTNETQIVKTRVDKIGQTSQKQGIRFKKIKACFVCKRVLTRTSLITPVKKNEKRAVHTVSTARPSISTARPNISTARPSVSTARPIYAIRPIYPRMDNVRPRGSCSPNKRSYYTKPAFRPKDLKQDVKTFGVKNMTTAGTRAVVNTGKGKMVTDLKKSRWVWRPKGEYLDHVSKDSGSFMLKKGNPEIVLQDHAVVDSGCSSHMTGNKAYLSDYEDFNGGFVAFGSDPKGDELKFNLFSVSQMCDKKNSVLFTDTECLILSPSFKLLDESQVVLRAPRKDDVYSLDLKNIVPSEGLTCLYANATTDESKLWHRRLVNTGSLQVNYGGLLVNSSWVEGMQGELLQFKLHKAWELRQLVIMEEPDLIRNSYQPWDVKLCRQVLWTILIQMQIVANSTSEAEIVASCKLLDCYEKRLIEVIKIHTDHNAADLLTKGFDVTRISMDLRMDRCSAGKYYSYMVYKHNMVAFLKKPNESVGFTKVVDFLKGSSLTYALFHNPTIYDSLVKQFWQTATVRTLANGTQQLVASIDSKEYTITEASVRSKLQLADATGIHNLSDAKIYAGLATLGYVTEGDFVLLLPAMLAGAAMDQGGGSAQPAEPHHTPVDPLPSTSLPHIPSPPLQSPPHSPLQSPSHAPLQSPPHLPLQSSPYSPPHYSPPRVTSLEKELKETKQTLGNDVLNLVKKVKSLEIALKRKSKKVLVSASEGEEPEDQGRIIQDIDDDPLVSLFRESMKEKSTNFVTPTKASGEAQEEEISPTILEAAKTLSKVASQSVSKAKSTDKGKRYRRRARSMAKNINTGLDAEDEINTGRVEINTGIEDVNTGSTKVDTGRTSISTSSIILSPKKGQREGKAQMVEEDIQATHKTKEQIRQEEAGLEEAIRLQAQMDEEVAKQIHLDKMVAKRVQEEQELSEQQLKRKAEVQEAAQFYTEEDWDTIRAKLEANTEVVKSLQGESISNDDFAKRMVEMINEKKKFYAEQKAKAKRSKPMTQAQQREYMSTFIKNQSSWKLSQLKKLSFEELKTEFEKLMKSIESFVPMETEARVKRHGLQLEQETLKKQKIDIEDASITKGKDEVVKEEEAEVPVKKTGMRRKQKARKGINIDKTAQDEFNKEREAYVKDKVKDASSESEIGVDAIPTATKPPTIVNWKIISQSSQKAAYQIIRKDGSDKIYMSFGAILKDFSRDDLIELYRLVIKKYGANRPEEMYDRVLWGDLKTMFDPPLSDDAIWSLPLQQKIINWRYYPTCAVHCLTLDASTIYMLADRKYPLSKDACQVMLKMKLLDGTMDEVCYQLLKKIEKQAGIRK
ncbi:hypothetical protein Tco_0557929 [Tanacetum coccineum]